MQVQNVPKVHRPAKRPSLEEAQKLVGGRVEMLTLANGDQMLFNEEGRLLGLPPNVEATVILQESHLAPTVPILGDVIILSGKCRWK